MSDGALGGLSTEELRLAIRAVLADVLPTRVAPSAQSAQTVSLRSDADLDRFVRQIAVLCEDPVRRAALRDGEQRFRLAGGSEVGVPTSDASVLRVERGAVTERTVARAAKDGARLVLGARAVLTPLARDKARALGVRVEKDVKDVKDVTDVNERER